MRISIDRRARHDYGKEYNKPKPIWSSTEHTAHVVRDDHCFSKLAGFTDSGTD